MDEDKKWVLSALESARKLEKEGFDFYSKSAKKTRNPQGRAMFEFLANQEVRHYNVVNDYIPLFGGTKILINDEKTSESSVFGDANGGRAWEESDDLDALNIGIQTENRSIEIYSKIYDQTDDVKMQLAMKMILDEEKRHLSILEKEVEFITDTGEYHDFKTITM